MTALVKTVQITRIGNDDADTRPDLLAVEEPLEIRIGYGPESGRLQKNIAVTMRTPGNDFELAAGFLFTEGLITRAEDIHFIKYCTDLNSIENKENIVRVELHPNLDIDLSSLQRNFYTTSSCGVCGKESIESVRTVCRYLDQSGSLQVSKNVIRSLADALREAQPVFEHTGGLHASGLFDQHGKLLLLREDVGRHNALDKVIGAVVGNPEKTSGFTMPLADYVLLLSGRASFELIQKASMAGIRMVCAVGAPSSLAVQMAKEMQITLIGFLRQDRFNVYTHPERVVL